VTSAACGLVFFAVLGQTAWMLRPFFGRPSQTSIPFVRAPEGTLADALVTSSKSAAGIYERAAVPRAADTADVVPSIGHGVEPPVLESRPDEEFRR
jgi:hypothetical protein